MAHTPSKPTLPSPRMLLTSIFNSLSQTPSSTEGDLSDNISRTYPPGLAKSNALKNPLETFTIRHRSLFITLHVLFPSLLLQALDLLDRRLITRVVQVSPSGHEQLDIPGIHQSPQEHIYYTPNPNSVNLQQKTKPRENHFYLVLSAQSTYHHARSNSNSSTSTSRYSRDQSTHYIVRLAAWNCSCAAFAFSAFPGSTSGPFTPEYGVETKKALPVMRGAFIGCPDILLKERTLPGRTSGHDGDELPEWWFGGLSSDGIPGGAEGVPCCKHLLACLLAEKCEEELSDYIKNVRAGREEMAGLAAEA